MWDKICVPYNTWRVMEKLQGLLVMKNCKLQEVSIISDEK